VDHKLVVEIDGSHYHLGSKDAYRRDRRKDWLFQQHGYHVLRFLADDVVARLEEILATILTALDFCRDDLGQKGS
jgi:very-short-patch-repair endonuclease